MNASALGTAIRCCFSLTFLASVALAQENPPTASPRPEKPAEFLIQLEHVPVSEVAESLQQFIGGNDDIKIVPLALSNSLLIVGVQGDDADLLQDLVRLIDRKPPAVEIDVTIVQSTAPADAEANASELAGKADDVEAKIAALEKSGTLKVLERLQITTIDNQQAQLHIGKTQPMARGVNFSGPPGSGRSTPSFSMENVGSMLTASARVSGDDVLIEISVEKSWVTQAKPAGDGEASSFRPEEAQKLQILSTVRVPKGQAVQLGGMTTKAAGEQSRISAVVTAKIVR